MQPFLDLNDFLFQNLEPEHRDLPLKLLAYKAQHPEEKVPLALVLIGMGGSGKSLWCNIVQQAFGRYSAALSLTMMMGSQFNGWAERSLIGIIDEAEAPLMHQFRERVRGFISQKRVMLNEKFRRAKEINCYTMFIFNSNNRSAGSFGFDDRRMIVVDCPERREDAFYTPIWDWHREKGADHLIDYLLRMDLKGWRPPMIAPETAEKALARAEGMSPVEQVVAELREQGPAVIVQYLNAAMVWATRTETTNGPHAHRAGLVASSLPSIQIRPWYTTQELMMLLPNLTVQMGRGGRDATPGFISQKMREAGLVYLKNKDDPRGFDVMGKREQYLLLAEYDKYKDGITQEEFDARMKSFPRFGGRR